MSTIESFEARAGVLREQSQQRLPAEMLQATQQLIADLERTLVAQALQVGDTAPDFALPVAGQDTTIRLSEAVRSGPAVLSFYRGQWCPYCNLEVQALQSIDEDVRNQGGHIFLIGPETQDNAARLQEKTATAIPILTDEDGAVCAQYRLAFELPPALQQAYAAMGMDLSAANPKTGWRLPIPATFVVDQDRTIAARYVNADYTRRMEPANVLAAVRTAAARNPAA